MLNKITSHDQSAILALSLKGVRIDQIHQRFRNVSITEIQEICNKYYLEKQNESKSDKLSGKTGTRRTGKAKVQSKHKLQRKLSKSTKTQK